MKKGVEMTLEKREENLDFPRAKMFIFPRDPVCVFIHWRVALLETWLTSQRYGVPASGKSEEFFLLWYYFHRTGYRRRESTKRKRGKSKMKERSLLGKGFRHSGRISARARIPGISDFRGVREGEKGQGTVLDQAWMTRLCLSLYKETAAVVAQM